MFFTTSHSFAVTLSLVLGVVAQQQVLGQQQAPPTFTEVFKKRSRFSTTRDAKYSCTFRNLWTRPRHAHYPSSAHWSPPIIGSHSEEYSMWAPNTMATRGIENVAERGSRFNLQVEFSNAGNATNDMVWGFLSFNNQDPWQVLPDITVSKDTPLLSSISMVAPSPDWFSGFYDYDARYSKSSWAGEFIILTYPWDAGTEQGDEFSLDNDPENPHMPIFQLTKDTVPENGIFLNSDGTDVLPVVKWHCLLVDETPQPTPRIRGGNPDGIP